MIRPLQTRQRDQREEVGQLTALGADTAAGLRVLRGVGGEQAFFDRYQARSRGGPASPAFASPRRSRRSTRPRCCCPGSSSCSSRGSGAHLAASGDITTGELVAFYGYAAFLVIPLRTSAEAVEKITRALVGARADAAGARRRAHGRRARRSGRRAARRRAAHRSRARASTVEPGSLTCLVSASPDETSRARRPARAARSNDDGVLLGDTELDRLPLDGRCAAGSSSARPTR